MIQGMLEGFGELKVSVSHSPVGTDRTQAIDDGLSKLSTVTDQTYRGDFRNGMYHGRGEYRKKVLDRSGDVVVDSLEYSGDFVNGAFHGTGMELRFDGSSHAGEVFYLLISTIEMLKYVTFECLLM
jgi:hypothetical protein